MVNEIDKIYTPEFGCIKLNYLSRYIENQNIWNDYNSCWDEKSKSHDIPVVKQAKLVNRGPVRCTTVKIELIILRSNDAGI